MAKKKPPMPNLKQAHQILVPVSVSLEQILLGISQQYCDPHHNHFGQDELFELIKEIDLLAADYDFTKRLRDHFVAEMETMDKEEPSLESRFVMYEVRSGDTLSEIAERFGTTVIRLWTLNRIKNTAHIEPGWILLIPRKK